MAREYALSFEPESGGHVVAAGAYTAALVAAIEALGSARNAVAPVIAARRGWPVAQVRDCLEIGVAPAERGSLVVRIVIGVVSHDAHLDRAQLGATYWRLTSRMLRNAVSGRGAAGTELAAAGAESFARAARFAGEGNCRLRLVHRSGPDRRWATSADLTSLEQPLRAYAERRQKTRVARAQVIGQLATLSFEPATITLVTSSGRRSVRLPADLRDVARKLWGEDVVVDVEANITIEGDSRDMKAVAIRPVSRIDEAAFDKTLGSGKDVWGGDDARAYIDELRGRGERH